MADLPTSFSDSFQWPPDQALLAELRRLMSVLDALVLPAAQSKADYDSTVEALRQVILTRFNTTIQPIFDSIAASARLGAILSTTSVSTVVADLGSRAFIVTNGAQFAPAAYLMAQSVDTPSTMLFGSVISYDPNSGSLVMNVSTVLGTVGISRGNWRITAAATPQFLVTADQFNAYTKAQADVAIAAGDTAVTNNLLASIDALRVAVAAVNNTQDTQITALTGAVNTNASNISTLTTANNTNASNISTLSGRITTNANNISSLSSSVDAVTTTANAAKSATDALLVNVDANYNTLRKISDALGGAGAGALSYTTSQTLTAANKKQLIQNADLLLNTMDCKLVFTSTSVITLLPSDTGDKIFIAGNYYKIPAAGVTIAPSGTANSIRAVYYQGSSGTLQLSNTQPTRNATWGYWALPTDETWRHVGDVLIFSGPAFADFFVVSRANRVERERKSAYTLGSTGSQSDVITNTAFTLGMLVALGEDFSAEFIGHTMDNEGGDTTICTSTKMTMVVNGATSNSDPVLSSYFNLQFPTYNRLRIKATSTQGATGSVLTSNNKSGITSYIQGVTAVRTRQ